MSEQAFSEDYYVLDCLMITVFRHYNSGYYPTQ